MSPVSNTKNKNIKNITLISTKNYIDNKIRNSTNFFIKRNPFERTTFALDAFFFYRQFFYKMFSLIKYNEIIII